jgi:hypothetical protein
VAQPVDHRLDIRRHSFAPGHDDRFFGTGRGEDSLPLALIADSAAIERHLDALVGEPAAPCDGGGELGMVAAPGPIGGEVDLEEICDVGRLGAEAAELARLGGIGRSVGGRDWFDGGIGLRGRG